MFFKLKQAQCAVKDGLLDEAFILVDSNEIREHRKGQLLITALAGAFVIRSQDHFNNTLYARPILILLKHKSSLVTPLKSQHC